jgi:hypothetical protein
MTMHRTPVKYQAGPITRAERSIVFHADDGFPITGKLFENQSQSASGPLLLVSSAAAVRRGYYTNLPVT